MSANPKKKAVYIEPDTDAKLSALGGKNRAENIRRALALAEVAELLAEQLQVASNEASSFRVKQYDHALNQYEAAKAREAKQ